MDAATLLPFADALALRWLHALGRGCVEVTVFAGCVWLATRLCPRLPARVRFWLWWLACAKGLIVIFTRATLLGVPVPVPVPTVALGLGKVAAPLSRPVLPPVSSVAKAVFSSSLEKEPSDAPDKEVASSPVAQAVAQPSASPALLLGALYVVGMLGAVGGTLVQAVRARRLRKASTVLRDANLQQIADDVARVQGLRRPPALRICGEIHSPLVVGTGRATLLLPRDFARHVGEDGARLALAHEMAHVRRGDLWLAWVPVLLRLLLFFFPPIYLLVREVEQACEEACDAEALSVAPNARGVYGRLLLAVSQQAGRSTSPVALGMAAVPFRHLKRRLLAIQAQTGPLPRFVRAVGLILVPGFALLVVPWKGSRASADDLPLPIPEVLDTSLPRYQVVPLGDLGAGYSGQYSDARAISDAGQIVGSGSLRGGDGRGHAWVRAGMKTAPQDPSTGSEFGRSLAVGVNTQGLVAASAFNRWSRPRAFVWDGARHYLSGPRGYRYSEAAGINESGRVAATATRGQAVSGALPMRAFVWKEGQVQLLPGLGGPFSRAQGINAAGWVAGKADLARGSGEMGVTHACVWGPDGRPQDLGTLGGFYSAARAISDGGVAVGYSDTSDGTVHAFRADVAGGDGSMDDLGVLPGNEYSMAWGATETGNGVLVVGASATTRSGTNSRAVLWRGERALDLNRCIPSETGWTLEVARAINARGEIVGQGIIGGHRQAFLLRPVIARRRTIL